MLYTQTRNCFRKWDAKFLCNFQVQTDLPVQAGRRYLVLVDTNIVDHILRMNENVKLDEYMDFTCELKKSVVEYECDQDAN